MQCFSHTWVSTAEWIFGSSCYTEAFYLWPRETESIGSIVLVPDMKDDMMTEDFCVCVCVCVCKKGRGTHSNIIQLNELWGKKCRISLKTFKDLNKLNQSSLMTQQQYLQRPAPLRWMFLYSESLAVFGRFFSGRQRRLNESPSQVVGYWRFGLTRIDPKADVLETAFLWNLQSGFF